MALRPLGRDPFSKAAASDDVTGLRPLDYDPFEADRRAEEERERAEAARRAEEDRRTREAEIAARNEANAEAYRQGQRDALGAPQAAAGRAYGEAARGLLDGVKRVGASLAEDARQLVAPQRESWAETGRKFIQNFPERIEAFIGGIAMAGASQPVQNPMEQALSEGLTGRTFERDRAAEVARRGREGTLPGQPLYRAAVAEIAANAPDVDPESAQGYAYDLANAGADLAIMFGASAATRSPTVGASYMGAQVFGQQYAESIEAGRTNEEAVADGVFMGAAELVSERIPLGILMKPGRSFGGRVLKAAGAESAQEVVTEALQMGYDAGVLKEDITWGEAVERLKRSGIIGAGAGAGVATLSEPFVRGSRAVDPGPAADPEGEALRARGAELVDQDDVDSPLDTAIIAEGKALQEQALIDDEVSAILDRAGFPPLGTRVSVGFPEVRDPETGEVRSPGRAVGGLVSGGFTAANEELGLSDDGIRIDLDDGTKFEDFASAIRDGRATITPEIPLEQRARSEESQEEALPILAEEGRLVVTASHRTWQEFARKHGADVAQAVAKAQFDGEPITLDEARAIAETRRAERRAEREAQGIGAPVERDATSTAPSETAAGMDRNLLGTVTSLIYDNAAYNSLEATTLRLPLKREEIDALRAAGVDIGNDGTISRDVADSLIEQRDAANRRPVERQAPAVIRPAGEDAETARDALAALQRDPNLPDDVRNSARGLERYYNNIAGSGSFERKDYVRQANDILDRAGIAAAPTTVTTDRTGARNDKIVVQTAADLEAAGTRIAEPTEAQKEAGNYAKAHVVYAGFDVTVETPKGGTRSGRDPDGNEWSVEMPAAYGYVKRTTGADAEQVDVYLGDKPDSRRVVIIDQVDADTGAFDEHKVMLGFGDLTEALDAYDNAFNDGRGEARRGAVTVMSTGGFKNWLATGDTTRPVGDLEGWKPVNAAVRAEREAAATEAQPEIDEPAPGEIREQPITPADARQMGGTAIVDTPWRLISTLRQSAGGNRSRGAALIDPENGRYVSFEPKPGESAASLAQRAHRWAKANPASGEAQPDMLGGPDVATEQDTEETDAERYAREDADYQARAARAKPIVERATKIAEGLFGAGSESAAQVTAVNVAEAIVSAEYHSVLEQPFARQVFEELTGVKLPKDVQAFMAERDGKGFELADEAPASNLRKLIDERTGKADAAARSAAPEHKGGVEAKPIPAPYPLPVGEATMFAPVDEDLVALTVTPEAFAEITDEFTALFADPPAPVRLADKSKAEGVLSLDAAAKRIGGWRDHAFDQGEASAKLPFNDPLNNRNKVVLSLFDLTGTWAQPWADAGYDVRVFDIQRDADEDVELFSAEWFQENLPDVSEVYAILAAVPCTDFASSGARHFAAKDADGRTAKSVELLHQTLRTIEYWRPAVWAIENPVGRIASLGGLPKFAVTFNPSDVGAPYTKKTILWGKMHADRMPVAPVEPTEGSKMHARYGGKSLATKNARSETPEGFALSFFMANNHNDLPAEIRLADQYPEASGAVKAALKAGVTEARIRELMEDTYGNYEYEAARNALAAEVAGLGGGPRGGGRPRDVTNSGSETADTQNLTQRASAAPGVSDDRMDELRARLRQKLNQLNSGIDPEILAIGSELALGYLQRGVRKVAEVATRIADDLGTTAAKLKPYIEGWYMGARGMLRGQGEAIDDLDTLDAVEAYVDGLNEQAGSDVSPAEGEATDGRDTDDTATPAGDRAVAEGAEPDRMDAAAAGAQAGRGGDAARRGGARGVRDGGERADVRGDAGARSDGARPGGERGDADGVGAGARQRNGVARKPERGDGARNYVAPRGSLTREGGWKATAERNLDIIELVERIKAEQRAATPEEQALIVKFTGWGAGELRNGLFPANSVSRRGGEAKYTPPMWGDWKEIGQRAAKVLQGEALESALQSTQYAHYTSEAVVRSIWAGVQRLGFAGGKIFEPGMGTGLFAVAAPADVMAASRYTGIELDRFTAEVARQLLPQENVIAGDFIKQKFPDGFFDLAIGNPPFADITISADPDYKRHRFSLHDYFFAKSIDKVRPGGLLVFVTSRYTMDKLDSKARDYLAERGDLVGAIRLPQTAFKQNAGTEVVTDVLFIRKRMAGEPRGGAAWAKAEPVAALGAGINVNEYFVAHPEMVLGKPATTGSMYRANEYTVEPTGDIEAQFAEAVARLPEGVYSAEGPSLAAQVAAIQRDFDPTAKKEGGLYTKGGEVMVVDQGTGVPLSSIEKLSAADLKWLADYVGLRDAVKQAQADQLKDGPWEASLKALQAAYRSFVKKHGRISAFSTFERTTEDEDGNKTVNVYRRFKNQRLLEMDVESPLVSALERITEKGEIVDGNFLGGRTLNKPTRPKIETVHDAMGVSLDERGRLDLPHIAELLGRDVEAVIGELGDAIYQAPNGDWQTADEYLSGDVLAKLEEAETAAASDPRFERNVTALKDVQPKPLTADQISVRLGAGWVPVDDVRLFAREVLGFDTTIEYEPKTATWSVGAASGAGSRGARNVTSEWGTSDRSPAELLDAALNARELKVKRTDYGPPKREYTDPEATAKVNEIVKAMRDRFATWVWTDVARASRLLDLYNRSYNNIAPRRFDGSHLTLPGLSLKYKLHAHQKRAVWRIIQTGNTYLGHAVGAGKTLEMIVSAMEQRRLGLIRKPMFVVPNHMLDQFAREFLDAYPAAQIMVAGEKAFHTDNRRRFMAQAALNDLDAVIVTHSSFGKVAPSAESRREVLRTMIADLEIALEATDNDQRFARKAIEKQIEQLTQRFEGAASAAGKDKTLDFEEMGVDFLYVDEAHEFRKLDFATTQGQIKGIAPKGSQRALDLYIKTRWLHRTKPGRNLVLASGTPVTNTMGELYTVMRYMDEDAMERDGIAAFDAWAAMFGEVAAGFEQNSAGQYEIVSRFAKFVNVPELMKRVRNFMDVLTMSQLGDLVKRPDLKGGQPSLEIATPGPALKEYMQGELLPRIEASKKWKPTRDEPHNPDPIIAINTDGILSAIDLRFVGGENDPGSKLNRMIDKIVAKRAEVADLVFVDDAGKPEPIKGATQIVFSAKGFGEGVEGSRGFEVKSYINKRLVAGGYKPDEIAWIRDYNTHAKKERLFADMRAGKVKVLFGSPQNMGTGLNVQKRLKALHYLSPPWYPSDVEQPHGRILRQGNQNDEVEIYWYATKGTYDSTAWGMVARKGKFIEQALSGDDDLRKIEDVSEVNQYEMAAAMAAGDERAIQLAGLRGDVERLNRLEGAHFTEQNELRHKKGAAERRIGQLKAHLDKAVAAKEAVGSDAWRFSMTVGGSIYEKPGEAGKALLAKLQEAFDGFEVGVKRGEEVEERVEVGRYHGKHPIIARLSVSRFGSGEREKLINIEVETGPIAWAVTDRGTSTPDLGDAFDPVGLSQRIQNAVQRAPGEPARTQAQLDEAQTELKAVNRRLGAPFEHAAELAEKIADVARLEGELAAEGEAAKKEAEARAKGEAAATAPAATPADDDVAWPSVVDAAPGDAPSIGRRAGDRTTFGDATVDPTDTWMFKTWFGDSKVVDDAGKPLVVYHGGTTDQFASGRIAWFADEAAARSYASSRNGETITAAYLSIKNPASVADILGAMDAAGVAFDGMDDAAAANLALRNANVVIELRARGFDGARMADYDMTGRAIDAWAAFEPTQIKSVDNAGTFDPADPSIVAQVDTEQKARDVVALLRETPEPERRALADDLNARLREVGIDARVRLRVVDQIRTPAGEALGLWDAWAQRIDVSARSPEQMLRTLDHEIIHALRGLGLFTPAEWGSLVEAAESNPALMDRVRREWAGEMAQATAAVPGFDATEALREEAVAELFRNEAWRRREVANMGALRRLVEAIAERLLRFVEAVQNWHDGRGFQSAMAVIDKIEAGAIGAREGMGAQSYGRRYGSGTFRDARRAPKPAEVKFDDAETEERFQRAKGGIRSVETMKEDLATWLSSAVRTFTDHFPALGQKPEYADLREKLRALAATPQASKERVIRILRDITKGMTPADLDLFTRKVILDDLAWEAQNDRDLPFGFTPDTVAAEKAKIDAAVDADPKVKEAVRQRKLVVASVARDLRDAGVLTDEQLKNPAYFRHMVLEHAAGWQKYASGSIKQKLKSPKWARRLGSTKDINANYLEAEFDWLHKAITDVADAKIITWLKKSRLNIRDDLQAQARAANKAAVDELLADDLRDNSFVKGRRITSPLNEEWSKFKQDIAFGLKLITDALDAGGLVPPKHYEITAASLQAGAADERLFGFLQWVADGRHEGFEGAMIAFRAISQRRAWMQDQLGKDYADPMAIEDLVERFAPKGYTTWQPDEGRLLFTAKTLPEHVLDRLADVISKDPAGTIPAAEAIRAHRAVRNVLAMGGPKYQMVLPEEVATTLNDLRPERNEGPVAFLALRIHSEWKRWTLINPVRVIRYNLNNLSGDLDAIIAGNPRALRKVPQAMSELWRVLRKKERPSQRYTEAVERGVFDSNLSVQEIPELNDLDDFADLVAREGGAIANLKRYAGGPVVWLWKKLQKATLFRENIFRYAAYLDYVERIEAGENMESIGYGASLPQMVAGVSDERDRAALLARELVGDYGAISRGGEFIRRWLISFWSFQEINLKRYSRLILNAARLGRARGALVGGALGAGIAARTAAMLYLRMSLVYGAVWLWNNLLMGDEEDELSPEDRARLHLILGRTDDGQIITLRISGAFSDYLSWFGFPDASLAMREVEKGRANVWDVIGEMAAGPVNKVGTGLAPWFNLPIEGWSGQSLWPDLFDTRPIRDPARNVAETFTLDIPYDYLTGQPMRSGGETLARMVTNPRDPGEASYNRILGLAYEWEEKRTGREGGAPPRSPRSVALYNWRRAMRYGDAEAEARWLEELQQLGASRADLRASIRRASPYGPIAMKRRDEFRASLDGEEREALKRAEAYYEATFKR